MIPWILISCCVFLTACSADRQPGELFGPAEEGTLVIDALLIVDQPLPGIFVRQTVRPNVPYDQATAAVRGADVTIRQGERVFRYTEAPDSIGRYLPPANPSLVTPRTAYHLTVTAGDHQARATTRTPDRFTIQEAVMLDEQTLEVRRHFKTFADGADLVFTAPENQVIYLDGLLEARFRPIGVPAYQVGVFSLDLDSERVIEADFLDDEDYEEFERQSSSPPLRAVDGTLRLPWFTIFFGGRHLIKIYALDDNWFDFARSSPEQPNQGFGGLAGDDFERPLFSVEGGIGLFGSASVDSLGFVVLPKE
ncbi:MAG: DUF4249 family protein [Candidatus Latescibacteria bacterium]|nr:DUF4249 family protein [Candidatus Latescibacterota bacterium]